MQGYFMLGAPTETFKEVRRTISFAAKLDLDDAAFSITTPLPFTHLYDRTKELIQKRMEAFDYYSTSVFKPGVTLRPFVLPWLKRWAFIRFYLAPKRILKTLRLVLDPRQASRTLAKLKRL
jgi:radical SAM superfamily enzyme YgiQ (UPF0313 family)